MLTRAPKAGKDPDRADGRDVLPVDFDEEAYVAAHPDVRAAIKRGALVSGASHYMACGQFEGRRLKGSAGRAVTNLKDLDAEVEALRVLEQRSFSEWLRARADFHFEEDVSALPEDPTSAEYRATQLALYFLIAGVDTYNPWTAEPIGISLESSIDPFPYPFSSRDGELIGDHLVAIGNIARTIWAACPGGGRSILEYGCGTGFSTVLLASSGYKMTAVDINGDALKVVDAIAASRGLCVTTFNGEFGEVPDANQRFDVVLFYEAFHHCLDFIPLLRKLHDLLAEGGVVIFAGEPISDDFPKPWGLRLDGASLWEIRTRGWLELGFHEDFFMSILADTGWELEKRSSEGTPDIYVARQTSRA